MNKKQKAIDKHLKRKTLLTSADIKKIYKFYSTKDKIYRRYLVFEIGINTGMRSIEISSLTYEDVLKKEITVSTKNVERTIMLDNNLCNLIKRYCAQECITSGFVLQSSTYSSKPLSTKTLREDSMILGQETGVDREDEKFRRCRLHNYRVFFTGFAVDAIGKEATRVSLGHSTDAMTSHYYRLSPDKKKENTSIVAKQIRKLKPDKKQENTSIVAKKNRKPKGIVAKKNRKPKG